VIKVAALKEYRTVRRELGHGDDYPLTSAFAPEPTKGDPIANISLDRYLRKFNVASCIGPVVRRHCVHAA